MPDMLSVQTLQQPMGLPFCGCGSLWLQVCYYYTLITQLLHIYHTIITQLLHNYYTINTHLLHSYYIIIAHLLHNYPIINYFLFAWLMVVNC